MLKRIAYILLLIGSVPYLKAQNLVLNGSFEVYNQCPDFQGQIDRCYYWFQPLQVSTSDYFNECYDGYGLSENNIFGYQYARTGSGYAGVIPFANIGMANDNRREYIETKLESPLVSRQVYCVQFYVSLSNYSWRSVNQFGAFLSVDSVLSNIPYYEQPLIEENPQINNPSTIQLNDTLNWMLISGSFMAQGGEKFLTIGNFHSDSNTIVVLEPDSDNSIHSYYYIDDVVVYPCDAPIYSAYAGIDTTICIDSTYILQTSPRSQYEYAWLTLNGDTLSYNPSDTVTIKSDTAFVLMQRDFKFDITKDTIYIKSKDCTPIIPPEPPASYFEINPRLINDNTLQIHAHNYLGNVNVLLYDAIGKLIYRQAINISQPDQTTTLKTMDLASGFYVCKIMNGNGVLKSERVVVVKY